MLKISTNAVRAYSSVANVEKYDLCIVGGGIVGLATSQELINRHPTKKFIVLEKEKDLAIHQTGHNSGVIHAGIYYPPGSLKSQLCVEGLLKTYEYCDQHKIPYKKAGKLIVAVEDWELKVLDNLMERARLNKVPGAEMVNADQIRQIEPNCRGLRAIYSPMTGIVDWKRVAMHYGKVFEQKGGKIVTNYEVDEISQSDDPEYPIIIRKAGGSEPIYCKNLISCSGLQSDLVAKKTGCSGDPKIVPFRGDYLVLKQERVDLVKTNIYPVPNPKFPFLGVHFTPRIEGGVWLGPNAVLSFKREGYGRFDFSLKDTLDAVTYPGLIKLSMKNIKFGIEEYMGGMSMGRTVKALQRYVPSLKPEDVTRGPSGVRAQALDSTGKLVDDFIFDSGSGPLSERVIHVRNAPSPAATSSLAIGRMISDKISEKFKL